MNKFICLFFLLIFIGCSTLNSPGHITESMSGFDNTKEISMEPAWLVGGSNVIKFGLYQNSKMPDNQVILTAVVKDTCNFSDPNSLQFNIDGEKISLKSIDTVTHIETISGTYTSVSSFPAYNESSKRYDIDKQFIKKLLLAQNVWVKINLNRDYVEGEFSKDYPTSARPAFKKFYEKVWGFLEQ